MEGLKSNSSFNTERPVATITVILKSSDYYSDMPFVGVGILQYKRFTFAVDVKQGCLNISHGEQLETQEGAHGSTINHGAIWFRKYVEK